MKVGITFSAFDLLHAGHVLMLQEAKTQCDYLIVGLQVDPTYDRPKSKNRPTQFLLERYLQLKACKYVDEIIPYVYEKEIIDILEAIKIDVRIIGEDYLGKDFTGKDYSKKLGIKLYYNKRRHNYSTSNLIESIKNRKK